LTLEGACGWRQATVYGESGEVGAEVSSGKEREMEVEAAGNTAIAV
jgi:hypothetical protein